MGRELVADQRCDNGLEAVGLHARAGFGVPARMQITPTQRTAEEISE